MPNQTSREPVTDLPSLQYLRERVAAGWKLTALEWEREVETEISETPRWTEDIPYGLQVSTDCARLVDNPDETEVIIRALDMIVEDCPLSRVANELNRRGFRTRDGNAWSPTALFNLLPRMIQVGPRLFASEEWLLRRQRLPKVV
ncbi:MAG TPA: recombinase family protein [Bryobacteraceae bacterium]|nr:recombinase family protein [Bryobacteraceae bacterium]